MKQTVQDDKVKEKLGDNYEAIEDKLKQGEEVLQVAQVSKEEYEKAQKELEDFINPIMQKVVQEGGGETMFPGGGNPPPPPPPTSPTEPVDMEEID